MDNEIEMCRLFKWFNEKENIKNKLLIYLHFVKSKAKNQLDYTLHWIRKWEWHYYTLYNNVRYENIYTRMKNLNYHKYPMNGIIVFISFSLS